MLIEIRRVRRFAGSPHPWVRIETPIGRTAVPWLGPPDVVPGQQHVEWTINRQISWGRNAEPAAEPGPAILPGSHGVILRGRLTLTPDGTGVLDLDGSMILLDFAAPPPEAHPHWVDIQVPLEDVELHPSEL